MGVFVKCYYAILAACSMLLISLMSNLRVTVYPIGLGVLPRMTVLVLPFAASFQVDVWCCIFRLSTEALMLCFFASTPWIDLPWSGVVSQAERVCP